MGDVFAGSLSYAKQILNYDWKDAIQFASAAAALKSLKLGRTGNIPSQQEVSDFLQAEAGKG